MSVAKLPATIPLLLLGAGFCVAQAQVPITYAPHGCESVAVSVSAIRAESPSDQVRYSYKVNTSITNTSGKSILLTVTKVAVNQAPAGDETLTTTVRSLTAVDDNFFSADLLAPLASEEHEDLLAPFADQPTAAEGAVREVGVAGILFVQFADGSTCGDVQAAEEVLRGRGLVLERLRCLQRTYQTRGEGDFIGELSKPTQLAAIGGLQELYRQTGSVAAVIERLTTMLRNGELHLAGGLGKRSTL